MPFRVFPLKRHQQNTEERFLDYRCPEVRRPRFSFQLNKEVVQHQLVPTRGFEFGLTVDRVKIAKGAKEPLVGSTAIEEVDGKPKVPTRKLHSVPPAKCAPRRPEVQATGCSSVGLKVDGNLCFALGDPQDLIVDRGSQRPFVIRGTDGSNFEVSQTLMRGSEGKTHRGSVPDSGRLFKRTRSQFSEKCQRIPLLWMETFRGKE